MIYVFLANGFEEVEALTPVDMLRRCELDVITVGIGSEIIRGSHGIPVVTDIIDMELKLTKDVQMIVLPGGMPGTLNLESSKIVQETIDYCTKNDIYIAAICAAPSILGHKNILVDKEATCYDGFESQLIGAKLSDKNVCVCENIITANAVGSSIEFSLKLVETLISSDRSNLLGASIKCSLNQ